MISKLKNKGYGCEKVELKTNENYEIEELKITGIYEVKEEEDKNENVSTINQVIINEVQIGEKENCVKNQVVKGISTSEEKELKKYLNETYAVKE